MGYDIDSWKTKRLENLHIPLSALQVSDDLERRGYGVKVRVDAEGAYLEGIGSQAIEGAIDGDVFVVSEINVQGEGSGWSLHRVLEPALKHSTGILEAVLIWAGGDSVSRLVVEDGAVTQTPVDL